MTQLMELEAPSTVLGTPAKELALRVHSRHNAGPAQVVLLAGQKVSIGANADCTLRLAGPKLEPCYCFVLRGEAHDVVRALSPRTKLNGADFQDAPLRSGDRLQLDDVELEVLESANAAEQDRETEQRVLDALAQELHQQSESLDARQAETERRAQTLDAERAALQTERDALQSERSEIQAERDQLQSDRQAIQSQRDQLESLRTELADEQAKQSADRAAVDELAARVEAERKAVEASQAALAQELRQQTESLEGRRAEIDSHAQSLAAERSALQSERDALQAERRAIESEREQFTSLRTQLAAEQSRQVSDREAIAELARHVEAQRKAVEASQAAVAESERQWKAAQAEAASQAEATPQPLVDAVDTGAAEQALAAERETLAEQRAAWEEERRRWDRECERWEQESRQFQEELEERERQLQQSLAEFETLRAERSAEPYQEATAVENEPEHDRRAASRSATEAGEDEDSIHDYMQQLLQRASDKAKGPTPSGGRTSQAPAETRSVTPAPSPAKPAGPVERAPRRPDRPKPEQAVDLSKLREIANITAKGALDRHSEKQSAQKRLNRILLGGGGVAFLMIVLACLGFMPAITSALAVAATAVAFLGWRQYQLSLRRFDSARAEKPTEAAPTSEAAPNAAPGE